MSTSWEKTKAVQNTRDFLRRLMDPKKTPRIPRQIRKEAYARLKHYPSDIDLEAAHKGSPKNWGKP